jgi:hypothetical protein
MHSPVCLGPAPPLYPKSVGQLALVIFDAGAPDADTIARLVLQPVALGDGLPLFAGLTAPFVLDLIEARAYADGAVLHIYRPAPR